MNPKWFLALAISWPLVSASGQTAWNYSTKKDIAGKVTEYATAEQTASSGNTDDQLIIRCKSTCEVFVSVGHSIVDDQASVRVKFNDHSPTHYAVDRGEGSDSLFFGNPMAVVKAIRDNGGYMAVEYRPYQRVPVMVTFGVWNLPASMLARLNKWEQATRKAAQRRNTGHEQFCENLHAMCLKDPDWNASTNCSAYKVQCE